MSAMGQGGLPHYRALSTGAARADSSPEGQDRAGRGFEEATAQLVLSLIGDPDSPVRQAIVTEAAERVVEIHTVTTPQEIHHHPHITHTYPVTREYSGYQPDRFSWWWIIIGAIIGCLLALVSLLSVDASILDVIGIQPGTKVAVMNSVDQWWYWVVALIVGSALGAGVGLIASLWRNRDRD